MPALTRQQWDEVRRAYLGRSESVQAIADRFGVPRWALQHRARSEGWPPRRAGSRTPSPRTASGTIPVRRRLIRRLFRIIEAELDLMESRMEKQLKDLDRSADIPAVDRERNARAVATLVRSLDQVTEIAADLDRIPGGQPKSADADELFAEAERFRRELAERLSKFIPASSSA
jgi:hypothetical protein